MSDKPTPDEVLADFDNNEDRGYYDCTDRDLLDALREAIKQRNEAIKQRDSYFSQWESNVARLSRERDIYRKALDRIAQIPYRCTTSSWVNPEVAMRSECPSCIAQAAIKKWDAERGEG